YIDAAVDFLSHEYGDRFCFIAGDSTTTVPQFALDENETKFDLIYIDGNHSYLGCLTDIVNCQKIATKRSLIWIDDYESYEVKQAVEKCVLDGILVVDQVHTEDRHWLEAHYRLNPYPFTHRSDSYYSHQPVLYEIAMHSKGPIIEFGCGFGSTDLLHAICKENKRILISVEDHLEWLNIFKEKYKEDPWHQFFYVPGKPHKESDSVQHWIDFMYNSDLLNSLQFDVCFIDQHPFSARVEAIKFMKNKTKFVVLHDCDYFPMNQIMGKTIVPISESTHGDFDFSEVFKYSKIYYPGSPLWTAPPTLVGSDSEPVLLEINFNDY
ncbi:MAG TPA: class I SAM-dependent methyltransferase, partial [Chlamydiales bacterium]|nr:class I SAM-dependent methyltransferase [Chlamydiales bacterium]